MKKNTLALAGLVALTGFALTSCGPTDVEQGGDVYNKDAYNFIDAPTAPTYTALANSDVNVYLNYAGESGITYVSESSYFNPIENATYSKGSLLPTWTELGKVTKLNLKDVASYSDTSDADTYKTVSGQGFVTAQGERIDLFANTVKNINTMGADGKAVNLAEHLDKMPHFKAYLEANPSIRQQITVGDGEIYYTPYFDGYNEIERMFMMDISFVQKVLDVTSFDAFDTTASGSSDSKGVTGAYYQPFINADYNYADATTTVPVSVKATSKNITIKRTENIIKQQNTLLAAGTTGKALAQQFQNYIKAAFGDNVGEGKTYANYSEIFVGEAAAYNADELVALMRVIKANPKLISNGEKDEVEIFFPRGEAANRVANVLDLAQIWGIKGLDAEANNFYFDANGKLNSLATTQASFDALYLLNNLYNEGLIIENFYNVPASPSGTRYLDRYFKKTTNDYGYGFMMYDYSAATTAANDSVDGVGTNPGSRKVTTANYKLDSIRPVVSPLTMWATGTTWSHDQALTNMTGKSLIRYAESNRTLKTGSWCIPMPDASKDVTINVDGALRLMDVMFSEYGALVNTFGPTQYWYHPTNVEGTTPMISTNISGAEKAPFLSGALTQEIKASGKAFWNYMRENIGATHGIGGVRNNQADYQATNVYGQRGLDNVKNAIASGAMKLAQVMKTGEENFFASVPVNYSASVSSTAANAYDGLTQFWTDPKTTTKTNWVTIVAKTPSETVGTVTTSPSSSQELTLPQVLALQASYNTTFLYAYANSLGASYIPDYANVNAN